MGFNQYCAQCKCGGRSGRILARLIAFPLFLADLVLRQSICIQHKLLLCRFIHACPVMHIDASGALELRAHAVKSSSVYIKILLFLIDFPATLVIE